MSKFLTKMIKALGDDVCSVAEDGTIADNDTYIDTGSYSLNAILSGSIFKGHPANKTSALAAEEAAGKSFIVLQVISQFLRDNPTGVVFLNDTEGAHDKVSLKARGIDTSRVGIMNPETLEDLKNENHKLIQEYLATPEKDRVPMLIAIDSLTQLPSAKEMKDSSAGKEAGDMGIRQKVIRATFRVLRLSLSKARVPLIVTNHVYQSTGMFPTTEMAGGGGLKYAADIILTMKKQKDKNKETREVFGTIVHLQAAKSRIVKQYSEASCYISYKNGLHRYYGLLDWALECGVFTKSGNKIVLPTGKSVFEKELYKNAPNYFTDDVLQKIDELVKVKFGYGSGSEIESLDEITDEE